MAQTRAQRRKQRSTQQSTKNKGKTITQAHPESVDESSESSSSGTTTLSSDSSADHHVKQTRPKGKKRNIAANFGMDDDNDNDIDAIDDGTSTVHTDVRSYAYTNEDNGTIVAPARESGRHSRYSHRHPPKYKQSLSSREHKHNYRIPDSTRKISSDHIRHQRKDDKNKSKSTEQNIPVYINGRTYYRSVPSLQELVQQQHWNIENQMVKLSRVQSHLSHEQNDKKNAVTQRNFLFGILVVCVFLLICIVWRWAASCRPVASSKVSKKSSSSSTPSPSSTQVQEQIQKIVQLFQRMEQSTTRNNKTATSIWATQTCESIDQAKRIAHVTADIELQQYYDTLREKNPALVPVDIVNMRESSDQFQKNEHRALCDCSRNFH